MNNLMQDYVGQEVLVRSYDAGVYFGKLVSVGQEQVKLENVRNIWSWEGASSLSQIANDGIGGGKVTQSVPSMVINRVCQMMPLSDKARENLKDQRAWKY